MTFEVHTERDWVSAARWLLEEIPSGGVVGLIGPLGAGKTTFVRAFIELLAEQAGASVPRVVSPTYSIHARYSITDRLTVDHLDLYRLNTYDPNALAVLGMDDILGAQRKASGYVFIEWSAPSLNFLTATLTIDLQPDKRFLRLERIGA